MKFLQKLCLIREKHGIAAEILHGKVIIQAKSRREPLPFLQFSAGSDAKLKGLSLHLQEDISDPGLFCRILQENFVRSDGKTPDKEGRFAKAGFFFASCSRQKTAPSSSG